MTADDVHLRHDSLPSLSPALVTTILRRLIAGEASAEIALHHRQRLEQLLRAVRNANR
jgi:hypothetical protein